MLEEIKVILFKVNLKLFSTFLFWDWVLSSIGWPQTPYVTESDLVSTSWMLGWQVCTATPVLLGAGDQIQGFGHDREALYPRSRTPASETHLRKKNEVCTWGFILTVSMVTEVGWGRWGRGADQWTENSEANLHRHDQAIHLYSYSLVAEGQPLYNGARAIIHPLANRWPQPAPYTQNKINPPLTVDLIEKHKPIELFEEL